MTAKEPDKSVVRNNPGGLVTAASGAPVDAKSTNATVALPSKTFTRTIALSVSLTAR
jgi:hypothetical protein